MSSIGNPITDYEEFNNVILPIIKGNKNDGLLFPDNILSPTSTIFTVTRYQSEATANNKQKIIIGKNHEWFIGHSDQKSGVAYMGLWLTQQNDIQKVNRRTKIK